MKKNIIFKIGIVSAIFLPVVSFAAFTSLTSWIGDIRTIVSSLYTLVFGLALLFFMWSMGQVILKSGDPKAREEARQRMIWGIIALFIMFSIFGILRWIGTNLDIPVGGAQQNTGGTNNNSQPPQIPGSLLI
jgi:uncharacterized membrane protein